MSQVRYVLSQFVLPFVIGVSIAVLLVSWQRSQNYVIVQSRPEDTRPVQTHAEVELVDINQSGPEESIVEPRIDEEESKTVAVDEKLGHASAVSEEDWKARQARAERAAKGQWTCRHRWTRWLEQNSLYIPPELSDHLQRYNRLHDKLLYELPIEDAFKTSLTSAKNTVRYLVWRPVGEDMAGRLLSLVSAYLLALLTDRILLVNFPYMRHLFCEPFTRSSWIFPEKRLADLNKFVVMRDALKIRSPIRIARLKLKEGFQDDDSIFLTCNGNIKNMLGHAQMVLVESPVGFIELIAANPSHRARLAHLFQGQSIYSSLMHNLLHPSNDMWFRIIDAYHVHYTNDYDRPARLAVYLNGGDSPIATLALKHKLQCALAKMPVVDKLSRGRVLYYAPSSPTNNPKIWAQRIFSLPDGHKIVTATDENAKKGYLGDWRRLLTDIWMSSWTNLYVTSEPSQASLAALYYRGKEGLLVEEAGPEGECIFTELPPTYLQTVPESLTECALFRQAWRAKNKTKPKSDQL
jgi:xyloglucan fucosyltransferase